MMRHIRPHKIFDLLQSPISDRIVQIKIPYRTECWLIETFLLVTAMKVVEASRIFEFGTFRGATTLNLALNAPKMADIYTFDLDPEIAGNLEQDENSREISRQHLAQNGHMEFDEVIVNPVIHRLKGNSLTFTGAKKMDLIFVDGGHDTRTLACDTVNAFRMASNTGCIAWHDYENSDYPDVTPYLDGLADEGVPIFHVQESRMCFWFASKKIQVKLGLV